MRGNVYSILSVLSLIVGCVFLFNSLSGITGYVVAENVDASSSTIFGVAFFAGAMWLNYLSNKQRQGQAAMEFLTNYGWAIFIIILILGVLAYFGIFGNNQPDDDLLLPPPFLAQGSTYEDGTYTFEALNTAGVDVTLTQVKIGPCNNNVNKLVRAGDTIVVSTVCPQLQSREKVILYFIWLGSSLVQSAQGNVNLPGGTTGGTQTELPICGNGMVENEIGEFCDDGNTNLDDGCDDLCQIEDGYACVGEPSTCTHSGYCCSLSQYVDMDECVAASGVWSCAPPPICGNGGLCGGNSDCDFFGGEVCVYHDYPLGLGTCRQLGEECDDGNGNDGDDCNNQCMFTSCGNGVIDGNEECDDGNNLNGDGCSFNCIMTFQCSDWVDNDLDRRFDKADSLCTDPSDDSEGPDEI